ncbi:MAG TPA: TRAP transporter large permease subunit [Acetobacteraceae bacterium]|nr:TRAP transporter large permease subunit [Acetobacteraceae bacterium]
MMTAISPALETPASELEALLAPPRQRLHRGWTRAVDRAIGWIVEPVAAVLIVVEVGILGAGVFSRYVLQDSLVWGDELATILFLWLTMLGAAGAYRRDEHLRLTTVIRRVPPHIARVLETIGTVVVAVFSLELLAALVWPAGIPPASGLMELLSGSGASRFFAASYLGQETIDFTPSLGIARCYVLLGIVVGLTLILAIAVLRLIDDRPKTVALVLAATIMLSIAAWLGRDVFVALGNLSLVLFFVVFVGVEIAIGVPISFAFGMATLSYLAVATYVPLSVVAGQMDQATSNIVLLAAPMFVLLGLLMEGTGMARRMVDAIAAFVGHLRGGLNIALVVAMFLVSGISGSKLADMAAVAPVLFPEMARRGYKRSEMSALLSTSGAAMELIPPSLLLIIVGSVCNLSIQALFTAGLLPAALASLFLIVVALQRSRNERLELAPRVCWATRLRALAVASPALVLPFLIRYLVVAGIATATEVSTVGVVYTLIVGLVIYREFDWRRAYPILRETANLTGTILLIVTMATAMSWALTQSGFAVGLAQVLEHAPGGQASFWVLSILLFVVLGSVLEGIPVIVLFGTLLFPIAGELGIHEIHYAIVVILAMSIGLFAPPVGVGFYQSCAFGKVDPDLVVRTTLPYIAALMLALALIAAVPWISIGFL